MYSGAHAGRGLPVLREGIWPLRHRRAAAAPGRAARRALRRGGRFGPDHLSPAARQRRRLRPGPPCPRWRAARPGEGLGDHRYRPGTARLRAHACGAAVDLALASLDAAGSDSAGADPERALSDPLVSLYFYLFGPTLFYAGLLVLVFGLVRSGLFGFSVPGLATLGLLAVGVSRVVVGATTPPSSVTCSCSRGSRRSVARCSPGARHRPPGPGVDGPPGDPVDYGARELVDFSTHYVLLGEEGGSLTARDSYADYRVHATSPPAPMRRRSCSAPSPVLPPLAAARRTSPAAVS